MNTGENEANALIQGLQNAFRIRNDARMPAFFGGNQDPMEWLEEFNRSARINQYTDEYKLQVVSGYLQGTAGQWFNEAQEGQNPSIIGMIETKPLLKLPSWPLSEQLL